MPASILGAVGADTPGMTALLLATLFAVRAEDTTVRSYRDLAGRSVGH